MYHIVCAETIIIKWASLHHHHHHHHTKALWVVLLFSQSVCFPAEEQMKDTYKCQVSHFFPNRLFYCVGLFDRYVKADLFFVIRALSSR